jgi:hypothetical protein
MSDSPKRPAASAGSSTGRRVIAHRNTAYGPALPVAGLLALAELATRAARRDPDTASPLELVEQTFALLTREPHGPRLQLPGYPELPAGLSLHALRVRLATGRLTPFTRAAVWAQLITHARATPRTRRTNSNRRRGQGPGRAGWTVLVAGMALPELLGIVTAQTGGYRGDTADLEAGALAAFLAELRRPDLPTPTDPRTRARLLMAAHRGARTLRDLSTTTHTAAHTAAGDATGDDPAATPRQTATTNTAVTNTAASNTAPVATHDAVATAERSGHEGARR